MMGWLFFELAVALVGSVWLAVGVVCSVLRQRRRAAEEQWRHRVASELTAALLDDERPLSVPLQGVVARERLLAEVVAALMRTIYALNPAPLRQLLCEEGVDRWLVRRVQRSRGVERACYLKLAADLPSMQALVGEAVRHRGAKHRAVRFAALLVEMASDPSQLLRLVAEFEEPLTAVEVAEILALLRRGLLPVAYRPLLESESANLQRVGLALVAEFGIVEAEHELRQLLASADHEVALQSLYLLLMLRCSVPRREGGVVVARLSARERRRLVRFMVREAYDATQIRRLLGADEARYSERLAGSYKRALQTISMI